MEHNEKVSVNGWRDLLPLLTPCRVENPELADTYLDFEVGVAPADLPSPIESWAGKTVFPIRDEQGVLCGCAVDSGEWLCDGVVLYGLHKAKASILEKGYMFLVESCKDVLAMHAAGYTHTVGLGGMVILPAQIALLKEYTQYTRVMLRSSEEGNIAAAAIKEELQHESFECQIFALPEGASPATLFGTLDVDFYRKVIESLLHLVAIKERLLMAMCFCYRDTTVEIEGGTKLFVTALFNDLQAEGLLPDVLRNKEFLWYLSEGISLKEFPADFQVDIDDYETFSVLFYMLEEIYAKQEGGEPDEQASAVVDTFYKQYLEDKLKYMIPKMTYRIKHENNPEKRLQMQLLLEKYMEDYKIVLKDVEAHTFPNIDMEFDVLTRFTPEM